MTIDAIILHALAPVLGRTVLNQTRLIGEFDWTLNWASDRGPVTTDGQERPADPLGPSIFTAMREQLGLRLDAGHSPVDVVVIDQVHQPTAN
jgi:uncharacterized protein (TIGR03435 family)